MSVQQKQVPPEESAEVDLRESKSLTISAISQVARVNIDYESRPGYYLPAVLPSAELLSSFDVIPGNPVTIKKADLVTRVIRIRTGASAGVLVAY